MIKRTQGEILHKSLTVQRSGFKVLDDSEGIVEMMVSVFGNVDSYNERMMYGCYAKSITERNPTGLFMHNWEIPVAKTIEIRELKPNDPTLPQEIKANGGLYVKAQYNLETARGKDAFSDIKNGIISEFSVGYSEVKASWNKELSCKDIEEAYLYEWSSVVAGANPSTSVISAKKMNPKGSKVFNRIKAEFLGDCAEQDMTYAAVCDLGYTLLWQLARECCYGGMSKEDRISLFESAVEEFGELSSRVMGAMLPEENDMDADDMPMVGLLKEVENYCPKSEKFVLRDGVQLRELRDSLSNIHKGISLAGEKRARDRQKEGRVFSESTTNTILTECDAIITSATGLKEMVESAKPEKSDPSGLIMRLKLTGKLK